MLPTRGTVRRVIGGLPSPPQAIAYRLPPAEKTGDLKQFFDLAQHADRRSRMKILER